MHHSAYYIKDKNIGQSSITHNNIHKIFVAIHVSFINALNASFSNSAIMALSDIHSKRYALTLRDISKCSEMSCNVTFSNRLFYFSLILRVQISALYL